MFALTIIAYADVVFATTITLITFGQVPTPDGGWL